VKQNARRGVEASSPKELPQRLAAGPAGTDVSYSHVDGEDAAAPVDRNDGYRRDGRTAAPTAPHGHSASGRRPSYLETAKLDDQARRQLRSPSYVAEALIIERERAIEGDWLLQAC